MNDREYQKLVAALIDDPPKRAAAEIVSFDEMKEARKSELFRPGQKFVYEGTLYEIHTCEITEEPLVLLQKGRTIVTARIYAIELNLPVSEQWSNGTRRYWCERQPLKEFGIRWNY